MPNFASYILDATQKAIARVDATRRAFSAFWKSLVGRQPTVLTHIITSRCNCRCKTCDMWKGKSNGELNTTRVFEVIDKAVAAGVKVYAIWGGEPFLRKDLGTVMAYAKKRGLSTILLTNGTLLEQRAEEVCPHTDCLIVSIDSPDKMHDEIRGKDGVFDLAIKGIQRTLRFLNPIVMINTVVSIFNQDKIPDLLKLAKDLGVKICFEPMQVVDGHNNAYKLDDVAEATIFKHLIQEKHRGNTHLGNSISFYRNFVSGKNYTCHMPKGYLTIGPTGNIVTCDVLANSSSIGLGYQEGYFGNILDTDLRNLFKSVEYQEFIKKAERCNMCDYSCVIEYSKAYNLNPDALFTFTRLLLNI